MNLPQYSVASSVGRSLGGAVPVTKLLANGRASRVDELKAQPRKPGEASFFYADHHFQYDAVKVLPGEYYVSNEDLVVMTVLGSCIAACIWDGKARTGGMNHFMLPDHHDAGGPASDSARYGAYAMEMLINNLMKAGASRQRLEAKVFGAGRVLAGMTQMDVGARNAVFAQQTRIVTDGGSTYQGMMMSKSWLPYLGCCTSLTVPTPP